MTKFGNSEFTKPINYYNLDVIISVGYRVKSKNGIIFRKWANKILKEYLLRGYVVNQKRLEYLEKTIKLIDIAKVKGNISDKKITYNDCIEIINKLKFNNDSKLFALERDKGLEGIIGNIYQTFDKKDVYNSIEEKACNFLYMIIKNHVFIDGNKRIGATLFIYF